MCQEERLLRELLPSPSPTVENSQELHHTRSNEQWLVSSETHTAQTRNSVEVSKLHERAKLQEALQDQLSHQLQQELVTAEAMQHRLEEQQQQNKLLQHHLEKSQLDAETQQRQLELAQLEVEEAHQRAQLQDVLTEQLQSQLQEVTKQRDWYRQQNQQLDEQLTPAAVREGRLPQVRVTSSTDILKPFASTRPPVNTALCRVVLSLSAVLCCAMFCHAVLPSATSALKLLLICSNQSLSTHPLALHQGHLTQHLWPHLTPCKSAAMPCMDQTKLQHLLTAMSCTMESP